MVERKILLVVHMKLVQIDMLPKRKCHIKIIHLWVESAEKITGKRKKYEDVAISTIYNYQCYYTFYNFKKNVFKGFLLFIFNTRIKYEILWLWLAKCTSSCFKYWNSKIYLIKNLLLPYTILKKTL